MPLTPGMCLGAMVLLVLEGAPKRTHTRGVTAKRTLQTHLKRGETRLPGDCETGGIVPGWPLSRDLL